jgi:hypothetical protein
MNRFYDASSLINNIGYNDGEVSGAENVPGAR